MNRLKNPSVILSIVSHFVTLLTILHINVDIYVATGIVTTVCSILTLLGIMSDPTTKNKGYGDDLRDCTNCKNVSAHKHINGKSICVSCGFEEIDNVQDKEELQNIMNMAENIISDVTNKIQ
ncbi:MAG: phage holin [Oscillospiraceae bacterium]